MALAQAALHYKPYVMFPPLTQQATSENNTQVLNVEKNQSANPKEMIQDVRFEVIPAPTVALGLPLMTTAVAENLSNEKRTVTITYAASTIENNWSSQRHVNLHNSETSDVLNPFKKIVELFPGQREIVTFALSPEIYTANLSSSGEIKISAHFFVQETNQTWTGDDLSVIKRPTLVVEGPDKVKRGAEFSINITFSNPLPTELKNCIFKIHPTWNFTGFSINFRNIQPKESVVIEEIKLQPTNTICDISVSFNSDILKHVQGVKRIACKT